MRPGKKYMVLLFCFACMHVYAQEAIAVSHYVFPAFSKGKVQQKNGSMDEAMLNYNVLSKEMVFESGPGQYLALANPENTDTVFILDRKFVPVNNEFYELLTNSAYPLFLEYLCTVKEPGADIGYGMTSVTSASPAVKSLIKRGGAYNLKLPDGFEVIPVYVYWIFKDGKYLKANNAKQLVNALPDKKDRVNELIKKNNTNFTKRQDLIDLVKQL
jgi:hypothetical protein